jgi:hypothetical protein
MSAAVAEPASSAAKAAPASKCFFCMAMLG